MSKKVDLGPLERVMSDKGTLHWIGKDQPSSLCGRAPRKILRATISEDARPCSHCNRTKHLIDVAANHFAGVKK